MDELVPSGIDPIDWHLDGGVPDGSIVALSASPASQSQQILQEICYYNPTLYVTTERSDRGMSDIFERESRIDTNMVFVKNPPLSSLLEKTRSYWDQIKDTMNVIVDPMIHYESESTADYLEFLNHLSGALAETGSVAYLHCVTDSTEPNGREVTLRFADMVWDLSVEVKNDTIFHYLSVLKARRGIAPTERLKLKLKDGVDIDSRREIS